MPDTSGPLTAGELIKVLQEQDPNTPIWLSKDEEGNGFARVPMKESYSIQRVVPPEWGWTDDIYPDDRNAPSGSIRVLILWPDA